MHIADLDGRLHERRKAEAKRELRYAALYLSVLILIAWLCLR